MKKHHLQIGVGIFVIVVLGAFLLSISRTQDGAVPASDKTAAKPFTVSSVVVKDSYSSKTTTHTITGSVTVPTPCYTVTAKGSVDTSKDPQVIRIDLAIPTDTGLCLEEPAAKTFSVSASAPKSAVVSVFVNGTEASTTAH